MLTPQNFSSLLSIKMKKHNYLNKTIYTEIKIQTISFFINAIVLSLFGLFFTPWAIINFVNHAHSLSYGKVLPLIAGSVSIIAGQINLLLAYLSLNKMNFLKLKLNDDEIKQLKKDTKIFTQENENSTKETERTKKDLKKNSD